MSAPSSGAVLDASALLPIALAEEGSGSIEFIFESLDDGTFTSLHAPNLIFTETAHALLRAVRRERVSWEAATTAFRLIHELPIQIHEMPPFSQESSDVSYSHQIGAYDMVYINLAQRLNSPPIVNDLRLMKNAAHLCRIVDVQIAVEMIRRGDL